MRCSAACRSNSTCGTTSPAHSPVVMSRDREFARIAPIGVQRAVHGIGGTAEKASTISLSAFLPMRATVVLEALVRLALGEILLGHVVDELGDALRRHRADGQAVGGAVVFPLPAHEDAEVRHGRAADLARDAVEADVGQVMLAAGVEAAGHLDVQVAHGRVDRAALLPLHQALVQHGGQAARGGDAQLAGVGAGAGNDVLDLAGARPRRDPAA